MIRQRFYLLKYLALTSFIFILTLCFTRGFVNADIGWMPGAGGALTTDMQNDKISMQSEEVFIQIKANNNMFPDVENKYKGYYAHIQADFTMENTSIESVAQQVFFPFYTNHSLDGNPKDANWLQNVSIEKDEKQVTFSYKNLQNGKDVLACAVFNIDFTQSTTTRIRIVYDLQLNNRPHLDSVGFDYIMKTGATWAGTIGNGEITIDLSPLKVDHKESVQINDFFMIENNKLKWRFNNLEPDDSHNIKLSFDPNDINVWNQFPTNIVSTSTTYSFDNQPYSSKLNTNPNRIGWPEDYATVKSSPGYLFDKSQDSHGWYYENSDDAKKAFLNRYLRFNFDGNYTLSDMKIRTGIKVNNGQQDLYNIFERPKMMKITFSDGSFQDVALVDEPDIFQTVALNAVPTSSITLTAIDSYPGINTYVGIGRIAFEGMQKQSEQATSSSNNHNLKAKVIPQIYVFIASAIGLASAGIIFLLRKKGTIKIKEPVEKKIDIEK